MERQTPYADHNVNPYSAAQMQQMAMQRMQLNAGMSNFAGRPDPYITEKEHRNISSKVERQWQQDKNASIVSNPMSPHLYGEARQGGSSAARSFYEGQMPDPKVDLEKQTSKESRLSTHEQDMEIGYGEKLSSLNFEGLEQRFLDEIMQLAKEQSDAEDAENARHRERIMEINTRYQEKLSSLRPRKAKRTDEFLLKESQARFHLYQQAGQNHHSSSAGGPIDPRGYDGAAVAGETRRGYATSQFESSYRERPPFLRGGRNQEPDARVSSFPEGRVYNNTGGHYY